MKLYLFLVMAAATLVGCNRQPAPSTPPPTSPPVTEAPTETSGTPPTPAPEVGTLTLEELDLSGCGMALYPEGSNPRDAGIYLFSGLADEASGLVEENAPPTVGSMRMKIDGEMVRFIRTETSGEAIPGGQFASQTFVSEDGSTTATVEVAEVRADSEPEVNPISGATIRVSREGQETTVEAAGDSGC